MSEERLDDAPGARLAQARSEAGLAVRDVADALNLPIHVVDAIEQGDRDKLPDRVFAQGYVRAYAKLLDLEPTPFVAAFTAGYGDAPEPTDHAQPATEPARQPPYLLAGGGAALLLCILLWLLWPGGEPAAVPEGLTDDTPRLESDGAQPQTSGSSGVTVSDQPTETSADPGADSGIEPLATDAGSQAAAVEPSEPVAVASTAIAVTEPPQRLVMEFMEDCWVEIRSAEGTLLLADLGKAGSEIVFDAEGPVQLLLGYAPGARLRFNGELVPLVPHTRNNVANLVLGQ